MALVVLRPNGTVQQVGVITTASAAPHTVLSDSSDATRAQGSVDHGFLILDIGTTSLGALRVRDVALRVRDAHDSVGAGNQTGWAQLRDPSNASATTRGGNLPMSRGATNVDYQYGPKEVAGPDGVAWTQALLDRIQVKMAWIQASDGNFLGVQELYVDVNTNTRPVVSGVTVTGATTTTRPTVTWTYTDTEGDPQSRYRVYVYSAAQYGAAGFVAGSSQSTWDSGDLFGDGNTIDVPVDLTNATTYKAYVKGAQDWTGVPDELWWSTLVASSTFTISITPPPTPSLTATSDPSLPGYRVLLTTIAPINLATLNQSSLETDTAGWTALSNCTISRSTAYAAHGAASLQMSSTAAGTMTAEWSTRPVVAAGSAYFAKAYVRSAISARTVRVGIRWYDQAGALIGSTVYGGTATDATGADTVPVVSATAPANALTASVVLEVQSTGAAAEIHRWDKIGMWTGGDQLWSVGGDQGIATVLLERLRKVTMARGESRNWAHAQLESGGGLTLGVDGFYARATSLLRSAPIDGAHPAGVTSGGARMIVWHPLVGAFNGLDIGLSTAATDDQAPPYLMPAVPGSPQTLSCYLKGTAAVNARIFVIPVDATNTQVGTGTEVPSSTVALSTSAWTRYSTTITAPAGTCYLRGQVELTSGSADLDVLLTGVQLELGSAATALGPGVGEWIPTWETVRALDSTLPVSPGEQYRAYDHELPPGRPVLYRARTVAGTLASAPCPPVAVYMAPPSEPVLKSPFEPENAVVVVRAPDSISRSEEAAVFRSAGHDGDPVKITTWQSGDDGKLHIETVGSMELYRLRQLIGSTRPLLLQHHDGGQTYLLLDPASIEELSYSTPYHAVEATYAECKRPA